MSGGVARTLVWIRSACEEARPLECGEARTHATVQNFGGDRVGTLKLHNASTLHLDYGRASGIAVPIRGVCVCCSTGKCVDIGVRANKSGGRAGVQPSLPDTLAICVRPENKQTCSVQLQETIKTHRPIVRLGR